MVKIHSTLFLIALFLVPVWMPLWAACLEGRVVDAESGLPVSNALVQVHKRNKTALTDTLGKFELCGLDAEACDLTVSHATYEPRLIKIKSEQFASVLVEMNKKNVETGEVVVYANRHYSLNAPMPGMDVVGQAEIRSLPAFLGENDVLRAVQTLSGVQSVSEGNSGVLVRGGSAGQNLFLLDDMEILNPSHLMGIYSVFNPLISDQAEIYKGSAPVHLQGRLASTIAVNTLNPLNEKNALEANIGNISSTVAFHVKSRDEKIGLVLGYRQCYLNALGWAASHFIPDEKNYFKHYQYGFYDFNGKMVIKLSKNALLTAAWYTGNDAFAFKNEDLLYDATTNWGNQAFILTYQRKISDRSLVKHSINYSTTKSLFEGDVYDSFLKLDSRFSNWQQRNQWYHNLDRHEMQVGLDLFYQNTYPMDLIYDNQNDLMLRNSFFRNLGLIGYIGDRYKFSETCDLYLGVRTTADLAMDSTRRTWHLSFSPMISFSVKPKPGYSFKASYSTNSQHLHLASLSSMPMPNDIWVTSSPKIRPEISHQFSAGFYRAYEAYEFSAEVYGKYMTRQLLFNFETNSDRDLTFEEQFYVGKGLAYGVDLSFSKKTGKYTGFVNYSWSRSFRAFPEIEFGNWFNDKYDRPHDLSASLACQLNSRWNVSALWTFASGNNLTLPTGRYWMMGNVMNHYDGYNRFRLPNYHRLDVSANYQMKSRRLKESVLSFSVINLYNRANPYYAFFKVFSGVTRYDLEVKTMQASLFPLMPSISWRFKL